MADESPTQAAATYSHAWQAAEVLAPEASLLEDVDPALFGQALARELTATLRSPARAVGATTRLSERLAKIALAAGGRAMGHDRQGPLPVDPKDRRFADPAWTDNPLYYAIRQTYLAGREYALDLLDNRDSSASTEKARLAIGFLADALAPTNFLPTNPAALKRAFETGGASVVAGMRNLTDDLLHNGGRPRQVDLSGFEVGRNLAATPSKVVYRSDLIEILQYLPQTEQVHEVPLLLSPPWINKYYVMDLSPGRSFVEWAVQHGRTVFVISYRNPDASMAHTTMDDYLIKGPRTAIAVVCDITGSAKVDLVGLCLGGALTVMTAAYLVGTGDDRVGSLTLLNTMIDFSQPGQLGNFTDEATIAKLEKRMARTGYLEGREMAGTFDILRANDLIFNYVVSNWLLGQQPPAFDILAWNADSTRMPAAMHSFYLRSCYLENRVVRGTLELAGHWIDLCNIKRDAYVVAAINDHIVLWDASYQTTQELPGDIRFVLSSGGHIAGIVNPPNPKAWYETASDYPLDPNMWRENITRHTGSWWEDWAVWGSERAGALRDPPRTGSAQYPVLGDGPGTYVKG